VFYWLQASAFVLLRGGDTRKEDISGIKRGFIGKKEER
jgi:hypothetical protein